MALRLKYIKHLALLGIITLALQATISSKYYSMNVATVTTWHNSLVSILNPKVSRAEHRNVTANKTAAIDLKKVEVIPPIAHRDHHEGHNGFELAGLARNVCSSTPIRSTGPMNQVHVVIQKRLLYCPMEKIGTTFWRRLFYMITSKNQSKYITPYDVPINIALGNTRLFSQSVQTAKSRNMLSESSFSFLFVRNPYSRILSAFVDKLVPPNPFYWGAFGGKAVSLFRPNAAGFQKDAKGRPISRMSHKIPRQDVTFTEFMKLATYYETTGRSHDPHLISINKGCKPCTNPFKYIGRMETFKDDAMFIMRKVGLNDTAAALDQSFELFSLYDAIEDSIRSPFEWKKEVLKVINWDKALRRIWLKFQMRGIISMDTPFSLSPEEVNTITENEFIELVKKVHFESDPAQLKKQKVSVQREAFASVPLKDLKEFREAYKADFSLFGYDSSPSYIFDRGEEAVPPKLFFNYSHLN